MEFRLLTADYMQNVLQNYIILWNHYITIIIIIVTAVPFFSCLYSLSSVRAIISSGRPCDCQCESNTTLFHGSNVKNIFQYMTPCRRRFGVTCYFLSFVEPEGKVGLLRTSCSP